MESDEEDDHLIFALRHLFNEDGFVLNGKL